jgi:hypothetical protein
MPEGERERIPRMEIQDKYRHVLEACRAAFPGAEFRQYVGDLVSRSASE